MISKVMFPGIRIGKSNSKQLSGEIRGLPEFDQVLLCLMYMRRAYGAKDLMVIFGLKHFQAVSDVKQRWMPLLEKKGRQFQAAIGEVVDSQYLRESSPAKAKKNGLANVVGQADGTDYVGGKRHESGHCSQIITTALPNFGHSLRPSNILRNF